MIVAALAALLLLPGIYAYMVKSNLGLTGGVESMIQAAGLNLKKNDTDKDIIEANIAYTETRMLGR